MQAASMLQGLVIAALTQVEENYQITPYHMPEDHEMNTKCRKGSQKSVTQMKLKHSSFHDALIHMRQKLFHRPPTLT
jgi:hypothetical protein